MNMCPVLWQKEHGCMGYMRFLDLVVVGSSLVKFVLGKLALLSKSLWSVVLSAASAGLAEHCFLLILVGRGYINFQNMLT